MARLSLEQLREKKENLLRKSNAVRSLQNLARVREFQRKRLEAEIKALENPRSTSAKKIARRVGIRSAKLIFRGGVALGKHLSAVAAEQNAPVRKRRKPTRRKKIRRKK